MAKPYGGKIGNHFRLGNSQIEDDDEDITIVEGQITGGMDSQSDPVVIPTSRLTVAQGVRNRFGITFRRDGTVKLDPTKPNSSAVLDFYYFKKHAGTEHLIRFDQDKLYKRGAASWTEITGAGLTGTDVDRFSIVTAFDQLVFSNNGVEKIQVVNAGTTTYAALGNAPKYKYITAFYNRIVGAYYNEATPNPVQIGWSGDGNITEWDPLTDPSAGSGPLIESPEDVADHITGIFSLSSQLVVLRERSIFVATKQPIASQPFSFYCDVPGLGCNCPWSAQVVPGGIIYADAATRSVYVYSPGQAPKVISTPVERSIFDGLAVPNTAFSSYDKLTKEYSLAIPTTFGGDVNVWTYNFNTDSWVYDVRPSTITCISDVGALSSDISVDALTGTVDSLTGTVDALGVTSSRASVRVYGFSDGNIYREVEGAWYDYGTGLYSGTAFDSYFTSKCVTLPLHCNAIKALILSVRATSGFSAVLQFSPDNGGWYNLKTSTSYDSSVITISHREFIRCRKFKWRLIILGGGRFEVLHYKVVGNRITDAFTS